MLASIWSRGQWTGACDCALGGVSATGTLRRISLSVHAITLPLRAHASPEARHRAAARRSPRRMAKPPLRRIARRRRRRDDLIARVREAGLNSPIEAEAFAFVMEVMPEAGETGSELRAEIFRIADEAVSRFGHLAPAWAERRMKDAAHATDVVLALLIRRAILELLAVAPAQPSLS